MADRFQHAFTDPEEVQKQVDEYFESLVIYAHREVYDPDLEGEDGKPGCKIYKLVADGERMPGIAGLSYHLGINRRSFINWCSRALDEKQSEEVIAIAHVLIRAKSRIEMYQEQGLFDKERHRGSMFSLAVNYKWNAEEDTERGKGDAFVMNVIPPAVDSAEKLAIPKWEPTEEE
jgi:hypothetical protein